MDHRLRSSYDRTRKSATGNEIENIGKAIKILSDGISKNPYYRNALRLRVQLYTEIGELNNAYSDVKKLVSIKPDVSIYKYLECIFREGLGESPNVMSQCYNKSSELVAAETGDKKESDFGYICLLLLAKNPQGKMLAENFLKTLTNSTTDQYLRETLENFDRKKFLPSSKPSSFHQ